MDYLFRKNVSLVFIILNCIIIFLFSHQNGDASANLNDNFFIRKLAHFCEYLILGFFSFSYSSNFIKKKYISIFYPLLFVIFYAITDEIHQLFIPGRSGNMVDIAIDSIGGLSGILLSKYLKKINSTH